MGPDMVWGAGEFLSVGNFLSGQSLLAGVCYAYSETVTMRIWIMPEDDVQDGKVCVAVCCRCCGVLWCVVVCCSVFQCVAVCCSAMQCVAVCYSMMQCVAVCYSVLQCVAVCCSVL